MNKRLLFISSFNSEVFAFSGVSKKLHLEMNTFSHLGYLVDYIEINNNGVFLHTKERSIFLIAWKGSFHKTFVSFYREALKNVDLSYDVIYFRYEHISFSMLKFFKEFKDSTNGIVIGELPSHIGRPYRNSSFRTKLSFYVKSLMNNYLPKRIDYLVTFSDHKRLFNLPTIRIENFVDVELLNMKSRRIGSKVECNLLVVAQLSPAHGVDLIIKGLSKYYEKRQNINCYLNVVGDGEILDSLKALTKVLRLDKYVIFHGTLAGKELDKVFDKCDIGIGALAIFRKGSYKVSELKIREYTARGLPFIYNGFEPQLENQFFCKKISFSDQPIDMNNVIDFYLNFDFSKENLQKMRSFAEENFTADVQLKVVNDKIENYFETR